MIEVGIDDYGFTKKYPCNSYFDILMKEPYNIEFDFIKLDGRHAIDNGKVSDGTERDFRGKLKPEVTQQQQQKCVDDYVRCMDSLLEGGYAGRIIFEGVEHEEFARSIQDKANEKKQALELELQKKQQL